jgi:hypothetical protein
MSLDDVLGSGLARRRDGVPERRRDVLDDARGNCKSRETDERHEQGDGDEGDVRLEPRERPREIP